jgi:hypothetical protein
MEIKYDTPIEVNEKQYKKLMHECSGIVAGREENGKYYIKVWLMKYADYVRRVAGF